MALMVNQKLAEWVLSFYPPNTHTHTPSYVRPEFYSIKMLFPNGQTEEVERGRRRMKDDWKASHFTGVRGEKRFRHLCLWWADEDKYESSLERFFPPLDEAASCDIFLNSTPHVKPLLFLSFSLSLHLCLPAALTAASYKVDDCAVAYKEWWQIDCTAVMERPKERWQMMGLD